jgi:DNA-binding NarL/FixJ family response regulator
MRLVIIADHAVTAEALRREVVSGATFEVVGYVDGRRPSGDVIAHARPDVVLIDEMPDRAQTLARTREARTAAPHAKLVLTTGRVDRVWPAEAVAAGIDAAISRRMQPGCLGLVLREVVRGNIFHAFERLPQPDAPGLTARELEILQLVAAGAANARIARKLWVTEQTVKFHLSNVYRKLGVANRTEASHYAHVNGLLEAPLPAVAARGSLAVAA